jgi:hypothetical protein
MSISTAWLVENVEVVAPLAGNEPSPSKKLEDGVPAKVRTAA